MLTKVVNEFKNLIRISHPNIVEVYELYIDEINAKLYLLQELVEGTEMLNYITEIGHYTGKRAYDSREVS